MNSANRTDAMGRKKAEEWRFLGNLALSKLIVSPARALEIQTKLYPEKEMMGRPGIIYSPLRGEKQRKRSPVPDEDYKATAEIDSLPSWRRTTEFFGAEEELEKEEVGIAAVEELVAAD
jgi:hypothetical protein